MPRRTWTPYIHGFHFTARPKKKSQSFAVISSYFKAQSITVSSNFPLEWTMKRDDKVVGAGGVPFPSLEFYRRVHFRRGSTLGFEVTPQPDPFGSRKWARVDVWIYGLRKS